MDENGLVSGVSEELTKNLETLLKLAKEYGLNLAFVLLPGTAQTFELKGKATYDKVSQVIANPDTYIENVVAPVCEILSSYPDVVLSVDVPLQSGGGEIYDTSKIYGTSWNVVQNFIKKKCRRGQEGPAERSGDGLLRRPRPDGGQRPGCSTTWASM